MLSTNQPHRILLVEDAPDQALLVGRWLTKYAGACVVVASSGQEALQVLHQRDFDLMLADIELPDMNGIDVAREASELRPFMSTALVTAHARVDYATRAVRCQVSDFLFKPLERIPLLEKVKTLVASSRARRQQEQNTVLAIGAHPDDVEIGCGGILLQHARAGDRVTILTLCGGDQGGESARRMDESRDAARAIGAELCFSDLEDTRIQPNAETIAAISREVNRLQPNIIYTHSGNDTHQDHRAAHQATLVAARTVANLYCYQSPSATTEFRPTAFIEIGSVLDEKLEVVGHYRSQVDKCAYLEGGLLRATARYWGRFAGHGRVEPLEVIRASRLFQAYTTPRPVSAEPNPLQVVA